MNYALQLAAEVQHLIKPKWFPQAQRPAMEHGAVKKLALEQRGEFTARELFDRLSERFNLRFSAVTTPVNRMHKAGLLRMVGWRRSSYGRRENVYEVAR